LSLFFFLKQHSKFEFCAGKGTLLFSGWNYKVWDIFSLCSWDWK